MTHIIQHPDNFKDGYRVLHLVSRKKDAPSNTSHILKISKSVEDYDKKLQYLVSQMQEGQRIYSSAEPRNMNKAVRSFREAQLKAEFNNDLDNFYYNIHSRIVSSLMQPHNSVKSRRLWMVDCDTEQEYATASYVFNGRNMQDCYEYKTKSGTHILFKPFDTRNYSTDFTSLIHKNPYMLVAY